MAGRVWVCSVPLRISATRCAGASSTSWYVARRRTSASLGDAAIPFLLLSVRSYAHIGLTSSRVSAPVAMGSFRIFGWNPEPVGPAPLPLPLEGLL